ncbi:YHYH domain-containing protein [Pontibacillus salicampi]|uniref:YHYH domain-containing protein n=1 Tax=Pontibacillus salicampi TaxID=1449801 RepID=A0ABV6LND0_9BACI
MKVLKQLAFIMVIILASLSFQEVSYAHSGRTDSSGGHNCSSKSQAKGLCSGYHYHNTGSSSHSSNSTSGQSTTTPSSTQSHDKDCSDFSSYDEVVAYWNKKGYSKDYDPERLDGWGNVVDDGIPCEVPSGYDTSKINGSPAQVAKVEEDNGEEDGHSVGYKDGYAKAAENSEASKGSEAYQEGYSSGYSKGYEEGLKEIEAEEKQAKKDGYNFGKENNKFAVPSKYKNNKVLSTSFSTGFDEAIAEKIKEKEKQFNTTGYEDGKKDSKNIPDDLEDNFVKAYMDGFEKGQKELEDTYIQKGYDDAFTMLNYKEPNFKQSRYISWYKEGFESNKEVIKIQETAYQQGLSGEEMTVPDEHSSSKEIFSHYYNEGFTEFKREQKEDTVVTLLFLGFISLGWLGRRYYVAMKMIA